MYGQYSRAGYDDSQIIDISNVQREDTSQDPANPMNKCTEATDQKFQRSTPTLWSHDNRLMRFPNFSHSMLDDFLRFFKSVKLSLNFENFET